MKCPKCQRARRLVANRRKRRELWLEDQKRREQVGDLADRVAEVMAERLRSDPEMAKVFRSVEVVDLEDETMPSELAEFMLKARKEGEV